MLKNLSDLGMGKKDTMEDVIYQEAEQVAERLRGSSGKAVSAKGMFLSATNNIIWRITTGKSTKQDDPELVDLTRRVADSSAVQDPSNPLTLLQMECITFTRLLSRLGLTNYLDTVAKILVKVDEMVDGSEACEGGNYVERGLYESEKDGSENNVCMNKADGRFYLRAQLADMFFAGGC